MAEIECKSCKNPRCDGCNVFTLSTALRQGELDWMMDEKRGIVVFEQYTPVKKAHWIKGDFYECSMCHRKQLWMNGAVYDYCPHCGAEMIEKENRNE